jgi:DNA-binding CsgD family transcriptional regulator
MAAVGVDSAGVGAVGASWPLVGRQAELEQAVERCRSGGVLISGPPGVGKTRLAAEVVDALAPSRVVQVRATGVSSRMPLGAFAQVLAASGQLEGDAARLAGAASRLLEVLEDGERLLVSVDDVQLLDDTSATLLLHLAMSGRAQLLLTLRTGESVPEPVTLLWRDELVSRLDLEPMDGRAMEELLDLALPGGVDGLARTTLLNAAGGNLLYLRELVTGLRERGVLSCERGHWELTDAVSAPPRLAELVELRLGAVSGAARTLLNAVALGEPLGVHGLERVEAWPLAQELLDAGLVELVQDGRRRQLRALHPLHVEVARSTMSEAARRQTLDGLADALERVGCRRRDDARRLAAWRLDAGRPADGAVLLDAAREALWARDAAMAERFASAALDLDELGVAERLEGAQLLGVALDDLGRFEDAEEVMRRYEPHAGAGRSRAMLALSRSGNLFRGLGRHEDAVAVLDAAERDVTDPALRRELLAQRASFSVFAGQPDRTMELVAPLLDGPDERAYCEGALQAAVAHVLAGRCSTAVQIATEAFEARIRLGDQVQLAEPGIHLVALALAQVDEGRVLEGHATARAAYEGAVAMGDRHGQAWLSVVLGRAELLRGRLADAARHGREAALVFGELRHPGTRWGFGLLMLAAGQRGDVATARAAAEDLDAEPPTPLSVMDVDLDRGRAWGLVAAGRHSAARELLAAAADRARSQGQHGLEAGALHDLARLGEAASVAARIDDLAATVQGSLMATRRDHVAALCADDGAALDAVTAAFESMGCLLLAAECASAAAAAHRRAGVPRSATASEHAAQRLVGECQGARTPALPSAPGTAELTRREREVADLAAQGLANREIADHLVVSVRTVENHLQRVYAKLGVSSRDQLRSTFTQG